MTAVELVMLGVVAVAFLLAGAVIMSQSMRARFLKANRDDEQD